MAFYYVNTDVFLSLFGFYKSLGSKCFFKGWRRSYLIMHCKKWPLKRQLWSRWYWPLETLKNYLIIYLYSYFATSFLSAVKIGQLSHFLPKIPLCGIPKCCMSMIGHTTNIHKLFSNDKSCFQECLTFAFVQILTKIACDQFSHFHYVGYWPK